MPLSLELYKKAMDSAALFSETDLTGCITDVNARFCALSGYRRDELIGQNHRLLKSDVHPPEFYAEIWRSLREQGLWHGDICNRHKNGALYWVATTLVTLTDSVSGQPCGYAAIRFDVSERYELLGQLRSLAYRDGLTSLPNRAALQACFDELAASAQAPGREVALCVIDIDHFSDLNEQHGHEAGDAVLRHLAQSLQHFVDADSTWVFHWGGDEFVLLLRRPGPAEALSSWVAAMLAQLAQPMAWRGGLLRVTCSAGLCDGRSGPGSPDQLLRYASQALYKAKAQGPQSLVCFGRDAFLLDHRAGVLQQTLREALAQGALQVYYQPKLDLRSGHVLGAEALLRWLDPQRGLVPPLEFLPHIENLPVALEIDEWVLQQALLFLQTHFADTPDFCVSVNISARQFQSPGFPARLKVLLDAHPQVGWHQLELEILESTAIEDFVQVDLNIAAIKAMGVSVALDDFGVGYSSLAYLKKISPQTLKIDKTFILGILLHEDDLILTQSILGLSRSLHVGVVAEGAETQEHMMLLARIGCTVVQGYGVLRPVAAAPFLAWWQAHQPQALGSSRWLPDWDLKHRHLLAAGQAYRALLEQPELWAQGLAPAQMQALHSLEQWAEALEPADALPLGEINVLLGQHRALCQHLQASASVPAPEAQLWPTTGGLPQRLSELMGRLRSLIEHIFYDQRPAGSGWSAQVPLQSLQ